MTPHYLTHWMKYFIPFLVVLIVGAGVALLMASGNYGPKAEAEAQQIQAQTQTQKARDEIDTKTYARQKELDLQTQAQLNALRVEQQKRLNDQEFAQNRDAHERWQALLQAGMWIVTMGAALAMAIAASAFAYKFFEQARAARQETQWQNQARVLQSQVLKLERQLQKQQTQLYALEHQNGNRRAREHEAEEMDWRELSQRLANLEANLNVLQLWRLEHSNNDGHALKNPTRSSTRDFPKAA